MLFDTNLKLEVEDIKCMLEESSKYDDLIKGTQAEDLPKFINTWERRNLPSFVNQDSTKFKFNDPINTFVHVALELSYPLTEAMPASLPLTREVAPLPLRAVLLI